MSESQPPNTPRDGRRPEDAWSPGARESARRAGVEPGAAPEKWAARPDRATGPARTWPLSDGSDGGPRTWSTTDPAGWKPHLVVANGRPLADYATLGEAEAAAEAFARGQWQGERHFRPGLSLEDVRARYRVRSQAQGSKPAEGAA